MKVKKRTIGKQYKRLPFDVKEMALDSRKISGYAAIFGVKDKADDILIKGCFAKSIAERGPDSQANVVSPSSSRMIRDFISRPILTIYH